MVCGKCNLEFANPKEVAKCSECGSEFHPSCCRIRTAAKLLGMSLKAVSSWRCDECAHETASAASRSDNDEPTVLELLKNISKEMKDCKRANKENFDSLQNSLDAVHLTLSEMKTKLLAVEAENEALKQECGLLRSDNESLVRRVKDLRRDMADIQQYTRCSNVEIRGVPLTPGEDVYAVLEAVAKGLKVPYLRQDISIAHRLPAPRDGRFHPTIIAQFSSRSTRSAWLAAARGRILQTTDLAASLAPGRVFVSDHLTPHNKDLLHRAKSLVRQGRLAYAWSRDGKILIREGVNSPVLRVWTVEDLERVCVSAPSHRRSGGVNVDGSPKIVS